jgi:aminoglycoside phosphotransferase (APT) family kinase protein
MLTPIPYHATASRPSWSALPAAVRAMVEGRAGTRIVDSASAGSGFTGGFASRLVGTDGRRLFVKASCDPVVADCYRREAIINAALPAPVPAPRVRWSAEVDGWVVLGFDDIAGRMPGWPSDLDAVLSMVTELACALTPPPAGLELRPIADETSLTFWRESAVAPDGWDLDLLISLEREWVAASAGDTMIHCDLRPDNLLVDGAGKVWICDWNWPCLAAPWLDLVLLLAGVHASGLDADRLLASHPVGSEAPADAVNAVLAAFAGMFVVQSAEPPPDFASPWLRPHQRFYGDATLGWLRSRLGLP